MADGFDRFDNNGGGGFVMGLLTGTVLGAGLGMLFAPKAGAELRSQLSEQAGNLANTATENYRKVTENAGQWAEKGRDAAGEWADKGKDVYGTAREAVTSGVDEAQRYVRDAASGVTITPPTGSPSSFGPTGTPGSGYSSGSSHRGGSEKTRASGSDSTRTSGSADSSSTASHSGGGHSEGSQPGSPRGSGRS